MPLYSQKTVGGLNTHAEYDSMLKKLHKCKCTRSSAQSIHLFGTEYTSFRSADKKTININSKYNRSIFFNKTQRTFPQAFKYDNAH